MNYGTFEKRTSKIPLWSFLLIFTTLVVNGCYFYARFNTPIDGAGSHFIGDRCVITAIQSGSPAELAGLKIGDTISQIEHIVVTGGNHLWMLQAYRPGDIISYQIVRNDEELEVFVPLGSYWSQYPVFYMLLYLVILLIFLTSIYILYKNHSIHQSGYFLFIFCCLPLLKIQGSFLLRNPMPVLPQSFLFSVLTCLALPFCISI
jgi:hypothetical protein